MKYLTLILSLLMLSACIVEPYHVRVEHPHYDHY